MSRQVFQSRHHDRGPEGLVDMLLGLESALSQGGVLVEKLAGGERTDAPLRPDDAAFVEVLLGVVAVLGAWERGLESLPRPSGNDDVDGIVDIGSLLR